MEIQIIQKKINKAEFKEIAKQGFGEMAKVVVDIGRKILAVGGELHADEEVILMENGSKPADLWGANVYLSKPKDQRIEFFALINIRPSQNNRSMEIQDLKIRGKVKEIVDKLIE